ncbi:MAG: trypsin-like peptidase domain-containing protein, partial [Deltaproteobacteria bacterium]|nr:trypsin-like peptidase domain-containing protein [Deltaproteobacteria bacterium]
MPAFRIRMTIIIPHFAFIVFALGGPCLAEDPVLRKAATPSNTRELSYGPTQMQKPAADLPKSRIGLAPMPFTPKPSEGTPSASENRRPERSIGLPDIREVVKKVNPSVVSIRMLDSTSAWPLKNLGMSGDPDAKAMGYGSGFVVGSNGLILTNEHVLRNGTRIEVELLGGKKYGARIVHKDSKNDLALLKIEATNLRPVTMGDSDQVELGEWVVGIGNPYGIGQSIMIGIVSAQKRMIPGSGYPALIQIDAAMNLGNSGGPLFNLDGEVVGINTILLWKSQGIGFATPINVAIGFLETRVGKNIRAAAAASPLAPMGPASDQPRLLQEPF